MYYDNVVSKQAWYLILGCATLIMFVSPQFLNAATTDGYLKDAQSYQQKGEYKAAIIQLKNLLQHEPNHVRARRMLGELYLRLGDGASAEKELARAWRLDPSQDEMRILLGRAYLLQGKAGKVLEELNPRDVESDSIKASMLAMHGQAQLVQRKTREAEKLFFKGLEIDHQSADAWIGLAQIAIARQDFEKAAEYADNVLEMAPHLAEGWIIKAEIARLNNELPAAMTAFRHALKIEPGNLQAHLGLAASELGLKEYDAAFQEVAAIRKVVPDHPLANYLEGMIFFQQRKMASARNALYKVLKAVPNHLPSHLMMGAIHYSLDQPEQAESYLSRYVAAVPDYMPARKLLAAVQLKNGEADEAIRLLESVLESIPQGDPQLYVLLGNAYMQQGDYSKGTEYFEKAVAIAPEESAIRTSLALGHLVAGETEQAVTQLETAIDMGKGLAQADILLILTYLQNREFDKAYESAQRFAANHPDNPMPYNMAGIARLGKGDAAAAKKSFEQALKIDPGFSAAAMNIARLSLQAGQLGEARHTLEKILSRDKTHMGAMLVLARIEKLEDHPDKAIKWLERAAEKNPTAVQPGLVLAGEWLRQGEKLKALAQARELYAKQPDHPAVLEFLGESQLANEESSNAVATFQKLAEIRPRSAHAHYLLGRAHSIAKDLKSATTSLQTALSLDPDYLPAQLLLADLALQSGQEEEALNIAGRIQQQHADSAAGYIVEGDIYRRNNQFAKAARAYSKGFQKEQSAPLALRLHKAIKETGDLAAARKPLESWLGQQPDDTKVRTALALALQDAGQTRRAIEQYQRILSIQKDNVVAMNNLAWLYQETGDPRSIDMARQAYDLAADRPAVMDTAGWVMIHNNEVSEGLVLIQEAAMRAPHIAEIRYHLAVALDRAGHRNEARKELERLLHSGRVFSQMKEARELLDQFNDKH